MGLIPKDKILDIVSANDIVEVLSEYIELKQSGKNYKALCPFHQEKTPSFIVSPDRQSWHCFGQCHEGGDVVRFIMRVESMSFVEALKLLADRANIPIEYEEYISSEKHEVSTSDLYEIMKLAGSFYAKNLRGSVGAEYFKNRGITSEMAKEFELGFAPDGWEILQKELKFYTPQHFEIAGLVIERKGGEGFYDRFRNRVMFPIKDSRERIIGFGARTLGDDMPKYLNSPATPIYNKSKALFGIAQAVKEIRRVRRAIIMEGYTDVIVAHQFGFRTAVATCGTALTDEHIRELNAADELFLLFDGDEAGKNAAERTIPMLIKAEKDAKIVLFPNNSDPCEFLLSQGDEAFSELIENGTDYMSYKFARINERFNIETPFGLNKSVAECVNLIRASKTPSMRMHLVQACAKYLNKPERILEEQAFPGKFRDKKKEKIDVFAEDTKNLKNLPETEKLADLLILLCMNLPEKIKEIRENFADLRFSDESREILENCFGSYINSTEKIINFSLLSEQAQNRINEIEEKFWQEDFDGSQNGKTNEKYESILSNCLLIKRNIELNQMHIRIKNRLKSVKDTSEKKELLEKLVKIQQELKKIDKHIQI